MKKSMLLGILIVTTSFLAFCSGLNQEKIIGVWEAQAENEFIIFRSDGTLQTFSHDGIWESSNDEPLTMKLIDEDSTYIGVRTIAFINNDEILLTTLDRENIRKQPAHGARGSRAAPKEIRMNRVINEIDQIETKKRVEEFRKRVVWGTRRSEAKIQINSIYNAARIYEKEFNYWPLSIDELKEKGYVHIDSFLELRWNFQIIDKLIQATSTSKMEGGAGHIVSYNTLDRTWEGLSFGGQAQ
jgi:hypothetical protein